MRNPEPESRPAFPDIQTVLQRPDFKLLTWTAEDVAAYAKEARTLGAPLEAGEELYTDIQNCYIYVYVILSLPKTNIVSQSHL